MRILYAMQIVKVGQMSVPYATGVGSFMEQLYSFLMFKCYDQITVKHILLAAYPAKGRLLLSPAVLVKKPGHAVYDKFVNV